MPATASLLEKHELGKFSFKRYFQQLFLRTNLILPWKKSNFRQFWCWLEGLRVLTTCEQEGSGYIEGNFWFFDKFVQKTSKHPLECLENIVYCLEYYILVFHSIVSYIIAEFISSLFVCWRIFSIHSVDLRASGPLTCHVQMFEVPGCPCQKNTGKNALWGTLFVIMQN